MKHSLIIHSTLIHAEFEKPALIEKWAKSRGFSLDLYRPFTGDDLPQVNDLDWLIVMGGPQSVLDIEKNSYLMDEVKLIEKAIAAGKTVLGICLGAQLISLALGAKCERSPHKEIGVFPITLTQQAKTDPLTCDLPDSFNVIHWHSDMIGLPEGSTVLASSTGCPRQIVRFRKKVYGFQCHFEQSKKDLSLLIENYKEDMNQGPYVQDPQTMLSSDLTQTHEMLFHILDKLVALNPIQVKIDA